MWVRISVLSKVGFLREKLIELRDHPLQLAKVGTKQMTTISEELPIYRKLQQHLCRTIPERELNSFWSQNRGRQHAHWIMKALLARDFPAARRGWAALKEYGQPWSQLAFWLRTANGRFSTRSPEEFFDRHASRDEVTLKRVPV
jgi:hypothetical protein